MAIYVPKELPLQDRKFLKQAALERKIAGVQLTGSEGTYQVLNDKGYGSNY